MMTRNNLTVFDNFMHDMGKELERTFIGADRIFDGVRNSLGAFDSYPPYNVEKIDDENYRISLALAGFDKKDIAVTKEGDWLLVSGKIEEKQDEKRREFLYRGIATRSFERRIRLAPDIEVGDAAMINGLLHVDLHRVVPEEQKPRTIKIK